MAGHVRYIELRKPRRRWPKVVGGIFLVIFTVVLAGGVAVVLVRPQPAIDLLEGFGVRVPVVLGGAGTGNGNSSSAKASQSSSAVTGRSADMRGFLAVGDKALTNQDEAELAEQKRLSSKTPLIARCSGVDIHCPVTMADLTGILLHQASYDYALKLETELPEAHYETIADTRTFFINRDQVAADGEWAQTEALHIWRSTDSTDIDTSLDVGALAGSVVKAPVSGTVVLVRDYRLYDEMDDVEIHIQPEGRNDLDCVLIHVTEPLVKAGDKVIGGKTDIAKVRDIESFLTDVQLGFFTPEGVGGNHTHVQMNDCNVPEYREKKLEGAITP